MINFATSISIFNKTFTKIEIGLIIEDICWVLSEEFINSWVVVICELCYDIGSCDLRGDVSSKFKH